MSAGILLLHGFGGSPEELAPLAGRLSGCGAAISAPLLAGHARTRADFARASYRDWIGSARDAANELAGRCDKLIAVGFSMGGLLAVNLCREMRIARLVFVNTPVYYWNAAQILANLSGNFRMSLRGYLASGMDKPLHALLEFQKLLSRTKPMFAGVTCPALVLQTQDDDTVNPVSAKYIFERVRGEKELKKIQSGGHEVFQSASAPEVCGEIEGFIKAELA